MKIVVTGANGFLGSHICRKLARQGHLVYALCRRGSDTHFLDHRRCTIIETDYRPEELEALLKATDGLVHVAAKASDWGDYHSFYQANVQLALTIHQLAAQCPELKVIHISSNAVIGEEDCRMLKNEEAPYRAYLPYFLERAIPSGMNHYKTTKELAEREVRKIYQRANHQLMILRPVWIFGPREFHAGPYEYLKTVKEGMPIMPGNKHNLFHTVYVEDVAEAVCLAFNKLSSNQLLGERIYLIGSEKVETMATFYQHFCKRIKKKLPLLIPSWPLLIPVTILEGIYTLFKIKTPPLLTRARLYMLQANNIYDVSKAKEELGFTSQTNMEQAIRKTVKWWKTYRYL